MRLNRQHKKRSEKVTLIHEWSLVCHRRAPAVLARASPLSTEIKRSHLPPTTTPSPPDAPPTRWAAALGCYEKQHRLRNTCCTKHADASFVTVVAFGGIFLSSTRQTPFLILSACFSLSLSGASSQLLVTAADCFLSLQQPPRVSLVWKRVARRTLCQPCVVGKSSDRS